MTEKLKFGMIGTNFISHTMAEAIEQSGCAEIHAVYSRKTETGVAFAEKYGVSSDRVYTSLEDIANSGLGLPQVLIGAQGQFLGEEAVALLGNRRFRGDGDDEYEQHRDKGDQCQHNKQR